MNKCFCHFNGYEVKDAKAREQLKNLYINNIDDMKNSLNLEVGNVVKTSEGNTYIITDEELTSNNLTIIKLYNGLYAKLVYTNEIYVSDVDLLTTELLTELINNNVHINTNGEYIPLNDQIEIEDNVVIENTNFIGNNKNTFGLILKGNNIIVNKCKFKGSNYNFLRVNGDNAIITNNIFDGSDNGSMISGVVIWNGDYFKVTNNTFINNCGFNLQTLYCKKGIIEGNTFKNEYNEYTYTAKGGETSIEFECNTLCDRSVTKINGSASNVTYNFDKPTMTQQITFSSPLVAGDIVYYRSYKSLECININSNSTDITIDSNNIDGTGDSGIVVGSDYLDGELNPTGTTSTDFPKRINISNNVITNCAYAGIGFTHSAKNCTVNGNVISNCGFLANDEWSSGINVAANARPITISNNSISNIDVNTLNNEIETGITKYGINLYSFDTSSIQNIFDYVKENKVVIKNNIIENIKRKYSFPDSIYTQPGVDIDLDTIYFDEIDGVKENTGYAALYGTGTCAISSSEKISNVYAMEINLTSGSDQYFVINDSHISNLKECIVNIDFFAKASDESKRAYILYNSDNVYRQTIKQTLSTEWKKYRMSFILKGKPSTFQFRFAPIGTVAGKVYVSNVRYSVQPIE